MTSAPSHRKRLEEEESVHYLKLSQDVILFEPINRLNSVFYDDLNQQILTVRSGGATGVISRGPSAHLNHTFQMSDQGSILSIKFSPDQKILSIQKTMKSVEFRNFNQGVLEPKEYSLHCRHKQARIKGFVWINAGQVIYISDQGVDQYSVNPLKMSFKLLKSVNLLIHWYVFIQSSSNTSTLVLATGDQGNTIHPLLFRTDTGTFTRLPKFELDLPTSSRGRAYTSSTSSAMTSSRVPMLTDKFVSLLDVYGDTYIAVICRPSGVHSKGAEVVLYQLQKESPARKTDILCMDDSSGNFALSVVDNLIVVHYQDAKVSLLYDIQLDAPFDGFVRRHQPLVKPLSIAPVKAPNEMDIDLKWVNYELYTQNWAVFRPNIIIDAARGIFWHLNLNLDALLDLCTDKLKLLQILLLRSNASSTILRQFKAIICTKEAGTPYLPTLALMFDQLCKAYRKYIEDSKDSSVSSSPSLGSVGPQEMYSSILHDLSEGCSPSGGGDFHWVVTVLLEYTRALHMNGIYVPHYLNQILIDTLVKNGRMYQLHQYLQYHVLNDSKPIAMQLLSLEGVYPPAHQLALDMLKRLGSANEEIIEILLSRCSIIHCLNFLRSVDLQDQVEPRKFLHFALNSGDENLFFTVYKFFEERNLRLRGSPKFLSADLCDSFTLYFIGHFGEAALLRVQDPTRKVRNEMILF